MGPVLFRNFDWQIPPDTEWWGGFLYSGENVSAFWTAAQGLTYRYQEIPSTRGNRNAKPLSLAEGWGIDVRVVLLAALKRPNQKFWHRRSHPEAIVSGFGWGESVVVHSENVPATLRILTGPLSITVCKTQKFPSTCWGFFLGGGTVVFKRVIGE